MIDSTDNEADISYTYIGEVNGSLYSSLPNSLDHLICPICRQPFIQPTQTQCGSHLPSIPPTPCQSRKMLISRHTFCESCITQSMQSSSLCPIDRLPISADEIKPAPKLVASLVNELIVLCPRGCKAEVERGSLVGHLNGRCELEVIVCECGKKCTRGELREVFKAEKEEGGEDEESSKEDGGCIHVYRQCNSCETNIQRLQWKVLPPHTLLFSLFVSSSLLIGFRHTFNLARINNPPVHTAQPSSQTQLSKHISKHVPPSHSHVRTPPSAAPPTPSPAHPSLPTSSPVPSPP